MIPLPDFTAEDIFRIHPKIRWAALANEKGEVLFMQMRPGLESLSPPDQDRVFMQIGPLMLVGVSERLAAWAGAVESVVITFEKVGMVIARVSGKYLALTVERSDVSALPEIMTTLLKK